MRVGELKFGTVAWELEHYPTGNVAKPLANARGHHQKSLVDRDKAEKIGEVPNRLVTRLETISNEFGKDG